ncbi:MAG: hypothetical protein Fur0034_19200 [Desulfuromonadia bacterium]
MTDGELTISIEEWVATITIDRQYLLNAMTPNLKRWSPMTRSGS